MHAKRTPGTADSALPASGEEGFAPSRRTFVKLAIGALASLPAVSAGVFAVPWAMRPQEALADQETDPVRIVAVNARQLGLAVTDKADGGNKPIAGASVTLTSRYNGMTGTLTSDADGVVVFDIAGFAEPRNEDTGEYAFNGSIHVEADGYRIFDIPLARLSGKAAMVVPTRALEPDRPYPVSVAFNEWDALYTENTFVQTAGNDGENTFHVRIAELTAAATIALFEDGASGPLATVPLASSAGEAEADLTGQFLLGGSALALTPGASWRMEITCGSFVYTFPLALRVMAGCTATPQSQDDTWLSPVNNTTAPDALSVTLPDFIPLFGGQQFYPWLPNWKVSFMLDPFGFFYLAWKSPRVGYVSDDGSTDPKKWGIHTYESASNQFAKAFDRAMDDSMSAYAKISKGAAATQLSFTPLFTCAASLRIEAVGKWDWDKGAIQGDAVAEAMLEVGFSLTEQFALGPVPFYISFGMAANFIAALGVGFTATDALDFSTYSFDYTNSGFTATFNFSPYLSLGVGLCGIASVGGRGTLTVTAFTGLTATPGPRYRLPHSVVGSNGQIVVEVQLFLFKWSGTLLSYDKPRILDSWEDDAKRPTDASALTASAAPYALSDGSFSYTAPEGLSASSIERNLWQVLAEEMVPVTAVELAATSEVELTSLLGAAPVPAQSLVTELADETGEAMGTEYSSDAALDIDVADLPWSQTALKAPAQPEVVLGVDRIDAENGGIWPWMDTRLMDEVFSDPRMKAVSVHDPEMPSLANEYLFRIASVEVNGQMRTRVVYHFSYQGSLGPANVVEFFSTHDFTTRDDYYDFDFDVTTNDEGTEIYLVLIYGPRPDGEGATVHGAWNDFVMAYVRFTVENGAISGYRTVTWVAPSVETAHDNEHLVFCPRITHISGTGADAVVAISWLHRHAYSADGGIGSTAAQTALDAVVGAFGDVYKWRFEENENAHLEDRTAYDLIASKTGRNDDGTWNMFFVIRGQAGSTVITARLDPRKEPPYIYPEFSDITCLGTHPMTARPAPWPAHEGFLSSYGGKLVHVLPGSAGNPLEIRDAGVDDFDVHSFSVDSTGTFIFYTQNRSGVVGREFDVDGNSTVVEADENRLMALKAYNGSFTDPYVLCNVSHPMENIVCLRPMVGAMGFLSSAIEDFGASQASMWLTVVPCTACFTILGAAAVPPVVVAGEEMHVLLTLRNEGNVHLTGAKMTIRDETDAVLASEWLPFSTQNLQASIWNPPAALGEGSAVMLEPSFAKAAAGSAAGAGSGGAAGATGHATPAGAPRPEVSAAVFRPGDAQGRAAATGAALLNAGADGELAPGKTGVYAATFTVPEDWKEEHFITITLGNADWVGAPSFPADADPVQLEATTLAGSLGVTALPQQSNVDYGSTQDAPVTVRKADDEPGPEPEPEPTPGPGPTPTPEPEPEPEPAPVIPPTGDAAGPVLGAAATLAAAAVGLAVYSSRYRDDGTPRTDDAVFGENE